jgi:hypothetical protein
LDYEAKILLEVPWVDAKLSRGWTLENRKFVINQCKTSALAQKLANSDDFAFVSKRKFKRIINFRNFRICSPSNRPSV